MIKQIFVVAAAALLATAAQAAYKDGTYTGEGKGNASTIKVQVDVKGGKVAAVKVVNHGETPMLLQAAEAQLTQDIVKANGTNGVQAVSGASNSSKGILEAVNNALKAAM